MSFDKFKPKSKNIGGLVVEVVPFPVRTAIARKFQLAKLLGSPILGFIKSFLTSLKQSKVGTSFSFSDFDLDTIPNELLSSVDPESLTKLVLDLCENVRVNDRELTEEVMNEVFVGDLLLLYKVVAFVLEVNYRDFFAQATTLNNVVAVK
jgi:hypothetical protein